jgi:enterochelin esterase-like enzyme
MKRLLLLTFIFLSTLFFSCSPKVKERTETIYSRHLQRDVSLQVIASKPPSDKRNMHLLIWLEAEQTAIPGKKELIDSLVKQGSIQDILLVSVNGRAGSEYGIGDVAGNARNEKADQLESFVSNELLPFVRKKAGIRKFQSVSIAGSGTAGLSALSIGWNHANQFQATGVFGAPIDWQAEAGSDTLHYPVMAYFQSSRKRPDGRFWFLEGTGQTRALADLLQQKKFIQPQQIQYVANPAANTSLSFWRSQLAAFLIWTQRP